MKRLRYNPYETITEEEYINIFNVLEDFEKRIAQVFNRDNWFLRKTLAEAEGLAISFYKESKLFKGSFALVFDDNKEGKTFSSTIAMFVDKDGIRYIMRHTVFEKDTLNYINDNLENNIIEALGIFNSWNIKQVMDLGERIN